MTSTLIKQLTAVMEKLKITKSSVTEKSVTQFIATCDAASKLGEYDTALNGYPLTDYKLAPAFSGVVLPRAVKLTSGFGMKSLANVPDHTDVELLSPAKFAMVQVEIFNLFRAKPNFDLTLEEASRPVLLSDVLDCLEFKTGVLCDGAPSRRPTNLNFTYSDKVQGIGELSKDEFVTELVYAIVSKIRG